MMFIRQQTVAAAAAFRVTARPGLAAVRSTHSLSRPEGKSTPLMMGAVFSSNVTTTSAGSGALFKRQSNAFCTEVPPPPPAPEATYEEVLALPQHPNTMLVDVREPQELLDTGIIPTSINVPLGDVATVFSAGMSPKLFKDRYGRIKPSADVQLIFACKIGRRSEMAAQMAIEMGYTNVKNYRGSWLDWAERNGLPQ